MRLNRRDFLARAALVPLLASVRSHAERRGVLVNDVHTGLNPTWVSRVVRPTSVPDIQNLIHECRRNGRVISVSGSRHATGGQQFAADSVLLDMRSLNRIVNLDKSTGILQIESGIEWPELIEGYLGLQGNLPAWGIRQKQGGANRMSVGGALSANAHGHDLGSPPIVDDVEWFDLVVADGSLKHCSRKENAELFSLAIGGYGLFGVIAAVGLRLVPRRKLRRRVEARTTAEIVDLIEKRTAEGQPYGYFQYSIDETSTEFMRTGVLTTYEPVSGDTPLGNKDTDLDPNLVTALLELAHLDQKAAYGRYASLELSLDGNVEWSDLHQLSTYPVGYHKIIERDRGPGFSGADLILEVYVPRDEVTTFIEEARRTLLKSETRLIYGTVRFIEKDRDTHLAWAQKRYACVIFAPHVAGTAGALKKSGEVCRELIQASVKRGGSFYLTYNRFAGRSELDAAYPQFPHFLSLKKKYDGAELLQSDWYRYYRALYE